MEELHAELGVIVDLSTLEMRFDNPRIVLAKQPSSVDEVDIFA